jgi:hypothetical protein
MITAVVTFKLPPGLTREQWQEQIKQVSTRFQNAPGLIRKQFIYNDKGLGGGVYLWAAEIVKKQGELESSGKSYPTP